MKQLIKLPKFLALVQRSHVLVKPLTSPLGWGVALGPALGHQGARTITAEQSTNHLHWVSGWSHVSPAGEINAHFQGFYEVLVPTYLQGSGLHRGCTRDAQTCLVIHQLSMSVLGHTSASPIPEALKCFAIFP